MNFIPDYRDIIERAKIEAYRQQTGSGASPDTKVHASPDDTAYLHKIRYTIRRGYGTSKRTYITEPKDRVMQWSQIVPIEAGLPQLWKRIGDARQAERREDFSKADARELAGEIGLALEKGAMSTDFPKSYRIFLARHRHVF